MNKTLKSRPPTKRVRRLPQGPHSKVAISDPHPDVEVAQTGPALLTAWDYQVDLWQRWWIFLDTLRERGNNMLEHEHAGQPPLLAFDHETILDARQFEHPANYALLRVTGAKDAGLKLRQRRGARPVLVVDPRAGHGPGIGGFKRDSEVGMALSEGHPVYFVMFFPDPCPGQRLSDVHHALRRFVAEVARRHGGQAPVLYGNCQAGWAVILLSADCVGLAGPAVVNGAPLSYWSGGAGINPMRLAGGLSGGTWAAHWLADLGNGSFDGAWLAQNFENLNPANTLWNKNYHLFANIDDERERFLDFERWWSGFYRLSREEILYIVEHLFVGNHLEQGLFRICEHCVADLKRIRNPILVFASSGDNITPPHQALNWIPAIYPTTQALKAAGQRIVYLLNPHVGHLGIFVSASVARREHRAILEQVEALEALAPGLYEMKIAGETGDADGEQPPLTVTFVPRRVEDLHFAYPREAFERVGKLSQFNEFLYSSFFSPWVRAASTPLSAHWLQWLHPMRMSRYAYSEQVNPAMAVARVLAQAARANRTPVDPKNPYLLAQHMAADVVSACLDSARAVRDQACESLFETVFGGLPGNASSVGHPEGEAQQLGSVQPGDKGSQGASRLVQ